jgi:uncharacterized protein YndB with AHSA1/START domain
MRTWILGAVLVVGGLVVLVGLVAAIGAALPRGHVATRTASFRQPPEAIFGAITDFTHAAAWRGDLERVELLESGSGLPRFREHGAHGAITMEVTELVPPRRLVVRIADPGLPFGGRWIYQVEPAAEGARLSITEEGEVYNPIFRFVSRFVFGHHKTLEDYLRALGRKFGEEVAPA